jgi:hypothetical protein
MFLWRMDLVPDCESCIHSAREYRDGWKLTSA